MCVSVCLLCLLYSAFKLTSRFFMQTIFVVICTYKYECAHTLPQQFEYGNICVYMLVFSGTRQLEDCLAAFLNCSMLKILKNSAASARTNDVFAYLLHATCIDCMWQYCRQRRGIYATCMNAVLASWY